MSEDGADLGIKPGRALKAIIGGQTNIHPDEKLKRDEMRKEIFSAPDDYVEGESTEDSYNKACLWLAKKFILILESGFDGTLDEIYNEMLKRYGKKDYGFSGFMVGWANNAARFVLFKPPQSNPAILEI